MDLTELPMNLTPGDLWKLRNIAIRAVNEAHEVLADAARRDQAEKRSDRPARGLSAAASDPAPRPQAAPLQPASEKIAFTLKETSRALGLSRSTIYKAIRDGRLPTSRVGGRRLVTRAALESFLGSASTSGDR